jgi:hypothetical protein
MPPSALSVPASPTTVTPMTGFMPQQFVMPTQMVNSGFLPGGGVYPQGELCLL